MESMEVPDTVKQMFETLMVEDEKDHVGRNVHIVDWIVTYSETEEEIHKSKRSHNTRGAALCCH